MAKIFVFGSNVAGRHGAGSALEAARSYGAKYGVGEGPTGTAYAIPTKDAQLMTLPLSEIEVAVSRFLDYAIEHPEHSFHVVRIGCGLAGYRDIDIAPMFCDAPTNVDLPPDWYELIRQTKQINKRF